MARKQVEYQEGTPTLSQEIKTLEKDTQRYDQRKPHKHPIPRIMEIKVLGQKLTNFEWEKFCNKIFKYNKYQDYCDRRHDGSLIFFGELGIDAAALLDKKFPNRFHFDMICIDEERAKASASLAKEKNLPLRQITYNITRNFKENINDPNLLQKLSNVNDPEKINVKLA